MVRTLLLYESKYGTTEMIAKNLALILGPAKCCRTSEFKGEAGNFDVVVICTPVYSESVDCRILEYVLKNAGWIKEKKVILVCVCLSENMMDKYLKPLNDILEDSVRLQFAVGGKLIIDRLSKSDYEIIKKFCSYTGFPLKDFNKFNKDKFAEAAMTIKRFKDTGKRLMEYEKLKSEIKDFIKCHNTCALATGHDNYVRATPIEYMFMNGCIYILSEGGEKFLNIIFNPNVSVSIFEPYKNMNELAGMQITGDAKIIDTGSDEYISVIAYKGLKYETIKALPISLNLIKINIKLVEFLWSGFIKLGYDAKQIFYNTNNLL